MDTTAQTATAIDSPDQVPDAARLKQPYYLPDPSPWPILGGLGGLLLVLGIIFVAHYGSYIILLAGIAVLITTMAFWWRDVVRESSTPDLQSPIVRLGMRYGMMLFIASEVMFFVGFFWAFFNFALFPDVQGNGQTVWPPAGIETFDPFHLPFLNTMILLLSGCTVTWAHHALLENDRKAMIQALGLTILLGMSFTMFQAIEYSDAQFKFTGGVYPSTFFMATGFHGFHVMVGTTFLIVCWFRARAGQFTPERHFGFEAAAWYWHFVDVVWLFLFTGIYWWGASAVVVSH